MPAIANGAPTALKNSVAASKIRRVRGYMAQEDCAWFPENATGLLRGLRFAPGFN